MVHPHLVSPIRSTADQLLQWPERGAAKVKVFPVEQPVDRSRRLSQKKLEPAGLHGAARIAADSPGIRFAAKQPRRGASGKQGAIGDTFYPLACRIVDFAIEPAEISSIVLPADGKNARQHDTVLAVHVEQEDIF